MLLLTAVSVKVIEAASRQGITRRLSSINFVQGRKDLSQCLHFPPFNVVSSFGGGMTAKNNHISCVHCLLQPINRIKPSDTMNFQRIPCKKRKQTDRQTHI